jgi:hypothetical protein
LIGQPRFRYILMKTKCYVLNNVYFNCFTHFRLVGYHCIATLRAFIIAICIDQYVTAGIGQYVVHLVLNLILLIALLMIMAGLSGVFKNLSCSAVLGLTSPDNWYCKVQLMKWRPNVQII